MNKAGSRWVSLHPARCARPRSAPTREDGYDLWLRYGRCRASGLQAYRSARSRARGRQRTSPTLKAARSRAEPRARRSAGRRARARERRRSQTGAILLGTPRSSPPSPGCGSISAASGPRASSSAVSRRRARATTVIAAQRATSACCTARSTSCACCRRAADRRARHRRAAPKRAAPRAQPLGQPRRHRRARLRGRLALGLAQAARTIVDPRYTRLRARQRLARHQRHGAQQRQRQRHHACTPAVPRQGRGAGRRVPALRHPRVSHRALQRADRDRRAEDRRSARSRACRPGGSAKADEIYRAIPDFGGFLVKANSEGQPGPQDYGRTPRRRRQHAGRRARAARRRRDVARVRLLATSSPTTAPSRRTPSSCRSTASSATTCCVQVKNGADRLPAARAVPSAVRRDAEDAADARSSRSPRSISASPRTSPTSAPLCEEVLQRRHVRARARARPSRSVIDGSLHGYTRTGIAGVSQHRHGPQLDRLARSTRPTGTPSAASPGIPTLLGARDRRRVGCA